MMQGAIDFHGGELTLLLEGVAEGRRFTLSEAVCIVSEVSGTGDVHELAGRVKLRSALEALGAEIFETSMLLGEAAYDVAPGWLGVPVGPGADSEEVLAQFLSRNS